MSDYTLAVDITGNDSDFSGAMDRARTKLQQADSQVNQLANRLKDAGGKMKDFGAKASIGLTLPLTIAGGAIVKAASDYSENLNKVDVAFGKSGGAVKEWADNAIKQFGLSKNQAMEATSLFGDMSTAMGLTQPAAAEMSTGLAGLAGDMASFKNVSVDEAMTALKGVFTGEGESLKGMGVVMNDATLSAYALEQGIKKPLSAMTQAEKVQLRYGFVTKMTANAQGDYARTSDGTANSIRTFKGTLDNLAIVMGQKVLPIFTPMVQKATDLAEKFANASPTVQNLVLGFGAAAAAIGPLAFGIGSVMKISSSLMLVGDKLIPMLGGTGSGFSALATAAKGFLLPMAPMIIGIGLLIAAFAYLWNTNEQFRTSIIETGKQLLAAVMPVIKQLGVVFGQVAAAVMPVAVQVAKMVGKLLVAIAPVVVFFAKVFGAVLTVVITVFSKILTKITDVFSAIKGAWGGLKSFVGGVFGGIADAIGSLVKTVKGFINNIIGGINGALGLINKIPGVEIGMIPKLATGTDNWGGGVAMMNERGGEVVNLPKGAQVIPHDLSKRYLKETSTRTLPAGAINYDYMADRIAAAMSRVTLRNIITLNGRVLADQLLPAIDKKLGIKQAFQKRGV